MPDPDAGLAEARVSRLRRLSGAAAGLAQAFQSSAGIWLTEETASKVISDESIDDFEPVTRYDQPSLMVTNAKIVHCSGDFKTMRDPFRFRA